MCASDEQHCVDAAVHLAIILDRAVSVAMSAFGEGVAYGYLRISAPDHFPACRDHSELTGEIGVSY